MGRLEGKIALVTGAGSGIGRGCAVALAAEGARVIVSDVDETGGRETCNEIGKAAQFHKLDVSDEGGWKAVAALIRKEMGALHVLVNNAGICISVPVAEMSYETWKRQLAINLDSMFLSSKYLIPLMTESGGGWRSIRCSARDRPPRPCAWRSSRACPAIAAARSGCWATLRLILAMPRRRCSPPRKPRFRGWRAAQRERFPPGAPSQSRVSQTLAPAPTTCADHRSNGPAREFPPRRCRGCRPGRSGRCARAHSAVAAHRYR